MIWQTIRRSRPAVRDCAANLHKVEEFFCAGRRDVCHLVPNQWSRANQEAKNIGRRLSRTASYSLLPREAAIFEIESNDAEARPPYAQDAIEIVSRFSMVVDDERDLWTDLPIPKIRTRNLYFLTA